MRSIALDFGNVTWARNAFIEELRQLGCPLGVGLDCLDEESEYIPEGYWRFITVGQNGVVDLDCSTSVEEARNHYDVYPIQDANIFLRRAKQYLKAETERPVS